MLGAIRIFQQQLTVANNVIHWRSEVVTQRRNLVLR
jgi:hypothetical protein